ncbi:dsRBD fold-containing protein [Streptomyces sp. NPDC091376]|uniref:dsRBD fold-containing protein n=1 Tax=Streptomyces sp. NPDC091376 TaxID=3365994 RepID=UPI0037FBF72B
MARTAEWRIRLDPFEEGRTTKAHARPDTGTTVLTGRGVARCRPACPDVAEIGDELAASRARHGFGRQLMMAAYGDIETLHHGYTIPDTGPGAAR